MPPETETQTTRQPIPAFNAALLVAFISIASSLSPPAAANAETVLPPDVESGRIEERLKRTPEPPPDDFLAPAATPEKLAIPKGTEKILIIVRSLKIEGATVYSPDELADAVGNLSKGQASVADIYRLAYRLQAKYTEDGYIMARANVASDGRNDGQIRIKITEGKVSRVTVENPGQIDGTIVQGIMDRIREINPFNVRRLEREVLLLNDLYGVSAKTYLEPGSEPASVAIDVAIGKAETKQFQTSISFDDYGSRYLGPLEASLSEQVQGALLPFDKLTFTGFAAIPTDELKFGTVSYSTPINSSGTTAGFSGSYGVTAPGYTLKSKDITGSTNSFSADFGQNLIRSRQQNLNLSLDLTAKEATSEILHSRLYDDRVRTGKLQVSYDNVDSLGGANAAAVSTTQGIDGLGASKTGCDDLSRADGHSGYTKFEMTLSRTQTLPASFSSLVSFAGQYALSPLLSSEQFGYGGQSFGRAYDPSQMTGDSGAAGLLEIRYGGLPALWSAAAEPYGFYDIGKVWNIHGEEESGASLGGGIRFSQSNGAAANFAVAKPLTHGVEDTMYGGPKSLRLLFSLSCSF